MERSADALGRLLGDDTYSAVAAKANVEGGLGHKYYEEWRVLDPISAEAKAIANQSKAYYDAIRGAVAIDFEALLTRDVFIDYNFEEVMYRWDHREKKIYVKFYGAQERIEPVAPDHRLYREALCSGREITREQYEKGFPRQ